MWLSKEISLVGFQKTFPILISTMGIDLEAPTTLLVNLKMYWWQVKALQLIVTDMHHPVHSNSRTAKLILEASVAHWQQKHPCAILITLPAYPLRLHTCSTQVIQSPYLKANHRGVLWFPQLVSHTWCAFHSDASYQNHHQTFFDTSCSFCL